MKVLALSSRPVFVVCDKEKCESCLEKEKSSWGLSSKWKGFLGFFKSGYNF